MSPGPSGGIRTRPTEVGLRNVLLRLVKGGPEDRAIEAGEIDAVVDHAGSNVILLPAARRALREVADRAAAASREAANETSIANSLLAALPPAEYQRLHAGLEPVMLRHGEVLHDPGEPIRHVYFPIDAVISLLTTAEGHPALEVGLIGHEGMVGIPLAPGIDVSFRRALVQGAGTAMRMESGTFRKAVLQSKPLQQALYRYEHALTGQIAQFAACTRFHEMQARLARYLLMTGDCARAREFRLTQKFLACMLGVRREGITQAASVLQKRKLIQYRRGKIMILDRKRLGAASCGCYQIVKRMYAGAYANG